MKLLPYRPLLSTGVLLAVLVAPSAGQVVLESGEFLIQERFGSFSSIPIDPVLDGTDWAAFFVDSGLDSVMSNGQLVSEAFLSSFGGYDCCLWVMGLTFPAGTNPILDATSIDDEALAAELNAKAAALVGMDLELIESTVSGVESVVLEGDLAGFELMVIEVGSYVVVRPAWSWDFDGSFVESDSKYRFKITARRCETGSVNAGNDFVTDVLYVNGSYGGSDRMVEAREGDLLTVTVLQPIAGGSGRFVVHGNLGLTSSGTTTPLPFGIGATCFPMLLSNGASPAIIANNIGKTSQVGGSEFFGVPMGDPDPATTSLLYPGLPLGTVITFQGVIVDPASSSLKSASTTNAVMVAVQ